MKLTVDCVLTHQLAALQNDSALAQLLAKAQVTQVQMPLEALVCAQHGLQAAPDYPIAAIAAAADGLEVGGDYWLRADPVHLVLQRDCFSLGEPVPLLVKREQVERMLASLNQHFTQDGLSFCIGKSGAWYLRLNKIPALQTTLPAVAADKNIHQFLPQGAAAAKWMAVLNEIQMLLHEHPANEARESAGEFAVNSVWFSAGGVMPLPLQPLTRKLQRDADLVVADSAFYQGLATYVGIPCQAVPPDMGRLLLGCGQLAHVRLQLPQLPNVDGTWLKALLAALKSKAISQLTLNLGFYEKSLIVDIKPLDIYKFWRSTKPVAHYLP